MEGVEGGGGQMGDVGHRLMADFALRPIGGAEQLQVIDLVLLAIGHLVEVERARRPLHGYTRAHGLHFSNTNSYIITGYITNVERGLSPLGPGPRVPVSEGNFRLAIEGQGKGVQASPPLVL